MGLLRLLGRGVRIGGSVLLGTGLAFGDDCHVPEGDINLNSRARSILPEFFNIEDELDGLSDAEYWVYNQDTNTVTVKDEKGHILYAEPKRNQNSRVQAFEDCLSTILVGGSQACEVNAVDEPAYGVLQAAKVVPPTPKPLIRSRPVVRKRQADADMY